MPGMKALLCVTLIFVLAAPPALAEGFERVTDGDKYALADASGFLLTDYIYDELYCYNTDPPFRVSRDGYAGYIYILSGRPGPGVPERQVGLCGHSRSAGHRPMVR